jgi:DNA (cytosine-5)-methyltransferase 1
MTDHIEEEFSFDGSTLTRRITAGDYSGENFLRNAKLKEDETYASLWWQMYLRGSLPDRSRSAGKVLKIVDLFCGCGGLVLGLKEAIAAVSREAEVALAVDTDDEVLRLYSSNLKPRDARCKNVNELIDYHVIARGNEASFSYQPEVIDSRLESLTNKVDFLVAGPPCQGHSNLNNHTRREDPRNLLYLSTVATAIALKARAIIIENVADVLSDKQQVVETSSQLLKNNEYHCTSWVLNASELSGAQTRRRHFLIATKKPMVALEKVSMLLKREPMTVEWAIGDLLGHEAAGNFDNSPTLSRENVNRIEYLFDNDAYDLPDKVRPECHKNGNTYPAVYGRLKWDMPSGTITTGYGTPGRGRYIHPLVKRVITPHEAARLQSFPDWFRFSAPDIPTPSRQLLSKCIGDAVPPVLGYVAALCALTGL